MHEILPKLWLGELTAATDTAMLKGAGLSHILTLNTAPLKERHSQEFAYKYIQVDDVIESDLLLKFEECFSFINDGVAGGGVLVHCMFGISRSATIVVAYVMYERKIPYKEAIQFVRSKRCQICPNPGFVYQLKLFESMKYQVNMAFQQMKQYHLYRQSRAVRSRGKDANISLAADPAQSPSADPKSVLFKCRMCRRVLFNETSLIQHTQPSKKRPTGQEQDENENEECQIGELFVEPLEWMEWCLTDMQGKLHCPKCMGKLGSFSWVGEPCVCQSWVCPAFHIARNRVDRCPPVVVTGGANNIQPPQTETPEALD